MRNTVIICGICLGLSSCATLTTKVSSVDDLNKSISDTRTKESQLIDNLQKNDQALKFISKDSKFCIDQKSRYAASIQNILKKEDSNITKNVKKAFDIFNKYNQTIYQINQDDAAFRTTLNTISTEVSNAPIINNYSVLLSAGNALVDKGKDVQKTVMLQDLAKRMEPLLETSVKTLKKNLTELTGGELEAFQNWDECERTALIFLRDGDTKIINPSSGVELRNSYLEYLIERETKITNPNIGAALDEILSQNKGLMTGKTNPDDMIDAFKKFEKVQQISATTIK